jgi:hypothetical protein
MVVLRLPLSALTFQLAGVCGYRSKYAPRSRSGVELTGSPTCSSSSSGLSHSFLCGEYGFVSLPPFYEHLKSPPYLLTDHRVSIK